MQALRIRVVDPELIYEACKNGKQKDVPKNIMKIFPDYFSNNKGFQPQLSGKAFTSDFLLIRYSVLICQHFEGEHFKNTATIY